ncbi:unnamed protein product [Somion occarium]|uniref:Polymerase nucleotidyl transferase domain-containing protein n=1 Tax=Somion occarium TaxID=3059160 RepID=A0ABP1E0N1_9APHY
MASPSSSEVLSVAQEATRIFASMGLQCCLVGGVGCLLYGCIRTPGDVDLVVVTYSYGQESLKNFLVAKNSNFYTRASKQIGATWRVLYYRLPGYRRSCKIVYLSDLPVMPLIPLLLLKLQAWSDHRASYRLDFQAKQHTDARDILRLLKIAVRKGEHLDKVAWLPSTFVDAGKERVVKFQDSQARRLLRRRSTGNSLYHHLKMQVDLESSQTFHFRDTDYRNIG